MVERLFLAVPRDCLRFVIVVFPDHTHLLFMTLIDNITIWKHLFQRKVTLRYTQRIDYHLNSCCSLAVDGAKLHGLIE